MKQFSQRQFKSTQFIEKQFSNGFIIPEVITPQGNGGVYIEPIRYVFTNDDDEVLCILTAIISEL